MVSLIEVAGGFKQAKVSLTCRPCYGCWGGSSAVAGPAPGRRWPPPPPATTHLVAAPRHQAVEHIHGIVTSSLQHKPGKS